MIKIYHNNRCSTSRAGLKLLEESGKEFEIVHYLEDVPTEEELSEIISFLGIKPLDLIRTKEEVWKQEYKEKKIHGKALIKLMVKNPKLIERPIVVNGDKAVIGRPVEKILEIL